MVLVQQISKGAARGSGILLQALRLPHNILLHLGMLLPHRTIHLAGMTNY